MKTIIVSILILIPLFVSAQEKFQTRQANYIYNLVTAKGADYFDKNFVEEAKKQGFVLDDDMIFINVAEALAKEGKTDEAISVFKFGANKFPEIIMLKNGLGEAYLEKGNKTEAKKCFQEVIKLRPENPRAKAGLNKCN
jgi:TolA-binding protein